MNISHRQVDAALSNPSKWLKERKSDSFGHPQLGYDSVVRYGIFHFHKTGDSGAAAGHLTRMLDRNAHRLKNPSRIQDAKDRLESYMQWAGQSGLVVVETGSLIDFSSGNGLSLRGRISRIDLLSDGYRAILLGALDVDWAASARMPLLQQAVAKKYSIPVEDTYVGVQNLDGSDLRFRRFPKDERNAALTRLQQLARDFGVAK